MIDPTQAYEDVIERLRDNLSIKVYETQVPEDSELEYSNGIPLPFAVVYTGAPTRAARGRHITNSRNDTTLLTWVIATYGARPSEARLYKGQVINLLTGWTPSDCGEMTLDGGWTYSRSSNSVRPTQFIEEVAFMARSNLSWNDIPW